MTERFFGWRPSPPDHRDIKYSVPRAVMESMPLEVDLRPTLAPVPVWDQGNIGSCGPHSAACDVVYDECKLGLLPTIPSRLFIYYNARLLMGTVNEDSGVYNRKLVQALAKYGTCDERLWPYDPFVFRAKPTDICYAEGAKRKVDVYLSVPQDLNQMKGCLASGDPFIFGFTVYDSMLTPAVEATGDIPMPSLHEGVRGGHDVLVVGYSDNAQRFYIRNSWGMDWGRSGYGTIPYSFATNPGLAGDFWTVRWKPAVTPTTTTTTTTTTTAPPVVTDLLSVRVDGAVRSVEVGGKQWGPLP